VSKHLISLLLAAIATAVLAAGCGGGSDDETASPSVETSSISRAEFVKRAEGICAKATRETEPVIEEGPSGDSGVEAIEAVFLPGAEDVVAEVRELGAPSGDQAQVEKLLTALQEAVDELEAQPASSLEELAERFHRFGTLAGNYGLQSCVFG
jgi:hypothetical protein